MCVECPPDYVALRAEGFSFMASCPLDACEELVLYWNSASLSNCVTTASYPPAAPGFVYVRHVAYALPLSGSDGAVLELWRGLDGPNKDHYFTLATDASRQEAQAAGFVLVAPIARLYLNASAPSANATAALAAAADVAIVCVSTPSGEGSDRGDLRLSPADDAMVAAILAAQPNTGERRVGRSRVRAMQSCP